MVKILRFCLVTIMLFLIASCGKESGQPVCDALNHVVSDYIQRNNKCDLYLMNFYSIGNLDLVTLEGGASYDGDLADQIL